MGATGAVGGEVWRCLSENSSVKQLTVLARREFYLPERDRETRHVVDTVNPVTYAHLLPGHDVAICTLGIGQPTQVPREEFDRVDYGAVLDFARACRSAGVQHFVLLGSVSANPSSSSFYLKSKGALRDAINQLGFASVSTFQPSMILTPQNRYGAMQGVMLVLWPIVSHLMIGPLSKFRGIGVDTLGQAIAQQAVRQPHSNAVFHWAEIMSLVQSRTRA